MIPVFQAKSHSDGTTNTISLALCMEYLHNGYLILASGIFLMDEMWSPMMVSTVVAHSVLAVSFSWLIPFNPLWVFPSMVDLLYSSSQIITLPYIRIYHIWYISIYIHIYIIYIIFHINHIPYQNIFSHLLNLSCTYMAAMRMYFSDLQLHKT